MVLEFPNSRNGWKLDAVGLLAVIGEATTETCVEPMTASKLCLLPRLIPAPQALIRPNRRLTLARVNASVIGVYSGATSSQISYIANQIYPITNLGPFSVRVLQVKHRNESNALPVRRATAQFFEDVLAPPKQDPMMKARTFSPHNVLSVASTLLTIGLLIWAIIIDDGPATISIVLLSFASTLFCAASLWNPPERRRHGVAMVPDGDVVIRTTQGAYLIVKCVETVASELYFGTDDIRQAITTGFSSCVGAGTVIFMVAVILMGNSSWTMQAALAVTYLLLNAVYWFVALIPSYFHWDFPRYTWQDITPADLRSIAPSNFATALWGAILETGSTAWVKRSSTTPNTPQWDRWLAEAEENVRVGNRGWDADEAKNRIMREPI
ncbi:hypothetical protein B0T10DRAFT_596833 [Thelonectria olida]|uniref:Uncharacterized protein n=1 Tax=Thelonectria olida TaxID=1576542 RepID=A0A9P9AQ65_9HYPO|nr:hypothetical protein B0T10DRAFT_596833 [Thelonectria olida]